MRFVLRRFGFFALTLWAALTLNFLLPRLMPGNPALAAIAGHRGSLSPDALKVMEAQFGLDGHGLYPRYLDRHRGRLAARRTGGQHHAAGIRDHDRGALFLAGPSPDQDQ